MSKPSSDGQDPARVIEDLWYKNAIIYSLDVETFMDANGDGIGDFEGLMRRLDYLQSLGVEVLWLAPFHPSPQKDNGYDVADHYGVHPRYGSSGDFVEFMHQAKKRGFRVIIDLVINHTSNEHPWFQAARQDEDSKYRSYYVWSKEKPEFMTDGVVFPGVQESTWTYDKKARAYFHHRFYEFQPDLNMINPKVRAEVRRIMGYWLELGVAGFRVDAVPFLLEANAPDKTEPERHFEYLDEMRQFLQWRVGDAILLGEANVAPEEMKPYFGGNGGAGSGIHMMFNFYVNQYLFYALATANSEPLAQALRETQGIPATAQWAQFLRNHDELDLGRLSDERREEVFARFAPEESMQLYRRGIRRRLAPMMGDRRREELAYSLIFSLPGSPVIRYGDEIGMGDDMRLDERDAVRTPMQWSNESQAGFSTNQEPVHPVIREGIYGYERVNVEAQRRDPESLLNWMTRMVRLRKECPEIGWGEWEILDIETPGVLAMRYEWHGAGLVTVHNFREIPRQVDLVVDVDGGETLVDLLNEGRSQSDDRKHQIFLEPHGYHWFRVGGLNYSVARASA
ncbi:MAG: alpha-amylase family protein [Trueperaceae bacterium]